MPAEMVLVVDDNPINLKLARVALTVEGYDVRTAAGAAEALTILEEVHPRLILMDLQMPEMDGLELTTHLKLDAATRDIIILAVTAYAMKGDEQKARDAGCDGYLTKPIDTRTLGAVVAQYLNAAAEAGAMSAADILIVEDNALMRKVTRITLEAEGYSVVEAEDGQQALAAVQRSRPALILQDLVLPDVDGMDLAGRVHALGGERIPIMAVTGFMARFDSLDVRSHDFTRLLYKPVSPADLVAAVESVVPRPPAEAPAADDSMPAGARMARCVRRPMPCAVMIAALAALLVPAGGWMAAAALLSVAVLSFAKALSAASERAASLARDMDEVRAGIEATVRERTAELQQAYEEMEAFSYSVSHDLRAPLRSVDGFSRILVEEYAGGLAPQAREYLGRVRTSAQRMGQLVDDLLALARLGRQPLQKDEVDMDGLVGECLAEVRELHAQRHIDVRLGRLPASFGDRRLLRQVVLNLLENAFKYTRDASAAAIEVSSSADESGAVYFVRDNGAGFDMQYAGKLFGVFQRMHSAEQFEGTGVGLAIVQRIVQRHGGRIWADASPGLGATFYFTLSGGHSHE